MISVLTGRIVSLASTNAVIDVGGVGFSVSITQTHSRSLHLGDTTTIDTILVVREDALTLFGFADAGQRSLFESLTGVTGVGPKLAMAILSELSPAEISRAVVDEDDKPFRSVSGIGPKTAKLITVSLAGRIEPLVSASPGARTNVANPHDDVVSALVGLGWSADQAQRAVDSALERDGASSASELLRAALSSLGRGDARV